MLFAQTCLQTTVAAALKASRVRIAILTFVKEGCVATELVSAMTVPLHASVMMGSQEHTAEKTCVSPVNAGVTEPVCELQEVSTVFVKTAGMGPYVRMISVSQIRVQTTAPASIHQMATIAHVLQGTVVQSAKQTCAPTVSMAAIVTDSLGKQYAIAQAHGKVTDVRQMWMIVPCHLA